MADRPPYVFKDTPPALAEAYQRRMTTFAGFSEREVRDAEERYAVQFPELFRTYLLEMGRACGDLFRGSDLAGIEDFSAFRNDALHLMQAADPILVVPEKAIVFLFHQGYTFTYFIGAGGADSPIFQYVEQEPAPQEIASGFGEFLDAELRLAEEAHRQQIAKGGYYLTVHPGGGVSEEYPALSSRPSRPGSAR